MDPAQPLTPEEGTAWVWVDADQLRDRAELVDPAEGHRAPAPEDVRELGLMAIEAEQAEPAGSAG